MKRFLIGTVILALVTIGAFAQNAVSKSPTIEMVFVEGRTFQMGSDDLNDSKPVHDVTVSSFYIGKTVVTQAQWKAVMGNNPSDFKGDNRPVECVSWYDAIVFCNKLSMMDKKTPVYSVNGKTDPETWNYEPCYGDCISGTITMNMKANGYRLPTEAEWEFAAWGGNKRNGYIFSGSDNLGTVAWYYDNSGDQTHDVATKAPNELGIYDMSGNVFEWCWDMYGSYTSNPQINPVCASTDIHVFRGGSWNNNAGKCRIDCRDGNHPSFRYDSYGFRLVRSAN